MSDKFWTSKPVTTFCNGIIWIMPLLAGMSAFFAIDAYFKYHSAPVQTKAYANVVVALPGVQCKTENQSNAYVVMCWPQAGANK